MALASPKQVKSHWIWEILNTFRILLQASPTVLAQKIKATALYDRFHSPFSGEEANHLSNSPYVRTTGHRFSTVLGE